MISAPMEPIGTIVLRDGEIVDSAALDMYLDRSSETNSRALELALCAALPSVNGRRYSCPMVGQKLTKSV